MNEKQYTSDSVVSSKPVPTTSSPVEQQRNRSVTVPRERVQTEFDRKDAGPIQKTAPPTYDNNTKRR